MIDLQENNKKFTDTFANLKPNLVGLFKDINSRVVMKDNRTDELNTSSPN